MEIIQRLGHVIYGLSIVLACVWAAGVLYIAHSDTNLPVAVPILLGCSIIVAIGRSLRYILCGRE